MVEQHDWLRIDAIFNASLELPVDERSRFLEQACAGEPELLAEVRELLELDARAQADGFLEHGAVLHRESQTEHQSDASGSGDLTGHETGGVELEVLGSWGRFELIDVLGEGGMGRVFKAHDPRLDRLIAIKVLHRLNPQLARRLAREARTQARIDHENVCRVYEIGELDNLPYIAMQLIDGQSLDQVAPYLTLEQKIVIMRQVATAVHAGHQRGIVHRDLKPGNVMLERSEDGSIKPYVLDFGLAREIDGASLTVTGEIHGTPGFMAPEQIEGGLARTDRRTDIFSLGASLYSILAGQHPFPGVTTAAVLLATVSAEPVSLRETIPGVPPDLEAIVMMCLEKQPERRYPSARALAEDLGRYLDGEPVTARPPGLWRRVLVTARRHRRRVAVATAALLVLLIFSGMWLHARWSARRQAELALRFGQEIERIEGVLWKARSLELHDMAPTNQMVRSYLVDLEQEIRQLGPIAYGPGYTALGRGYLALGELDTARRHLDTAWSTGFQTSQTAYALGLTLGRQYRRRLRELSARSSDKSQEGLEYQDAVRKYREPAREYLTRISPQAFDSPAYVEALLAASEGELEEALELARQAVGQREWLYEAVTLEGEVLSERGFRETHSGAYSDALGSYSAAMRAFERALTVARSDISAYEGACTVAERALHVRVWRVGGASEDELRQTLEVCERGLIAAPGSELLRWHLIEAHTSWAEHCLLRREDPTESLQCAKQWGTEMLASGGSAALAHRLLAEVLWLQGKHEIQQGKDPTNSFSEGIDHGNRALAADENDMASNVTLGLIYLEQGFYLAGKGLDSTSALTRAIELFETATSLAPSLAVGPINSGIAYLVLASAVANNENEVSERLIELLTKARENLQAALLIEPGNAKACEHLGNTCVFEARIALVRGEDPRPAFARAIEAFSNAIAAREDNADSYLSMAMTYQDMAQYDLALGVAPGDALDRARDALDRARSMLPDPDHGYELFLRQEQLEEEARALPRP